MELTGTIREIKSTQTFASGFQKREFILLTEEQYPQPISIEVMGDKIDIIDAFKPLDRVTVGINIRGREWTSPQGEIKYFNSITAWKITRKDIQSPAAQYEPTKAEPVKHGQSTLVNENPFSGDDDDDLPF